MQFLEKPTLTMNSSALLENCIDESSYLPRDKHSNVVMIRMRIIPRIYFILPILKVLQSFFGVSINFKVHLKQGLMKVNFFFFFQRKAFKNKFTHFNILNF